MRIRTLRQGICLLLSLCVALACAAPSLAAPIGDGVAPVYDEAYYATTDYYGNLAQGSVVKSYARNGAALLKDYGRYDEVVNLTDGSAPSAKDRETVTFRFGDDAPDRFYFEGKTAAPFENLPWTLSIHYTLNGVPARAEDLAGRTGVVEITVDAVPNLAASEYARNNYILAATAVFNQDDILSLAAPGAQIQLIGNLRTALFMAFPGEEAQFVIRVGADSFSFGGMTFLLAPATLSQLDEIAKLSERKEDLEDSYHKLSDSLDAVLDTFHNVQDSLNETADGLDKLDEARQTLSRGKGTIYGNVDTLRGDLKAVASALDPVAQDARDTSAFVSRARAAVNALMDAALQLNGDMTAMQKVLQPLEAGLSRMETGLKAVEHSLDASSLGLEDIENALRKTEFSLSDLEERLTAGAEGLRDTADNLVLVEDALDLTGDSLAALEENLLDLDGCMENLAGRLTELESGLAEVEGGAEDVKDLLNEVMDMEKDLRNLSEALDEVQGVSGGRGSVSSEFRDTLSKIELFDQAYQEAEFPAFLADMLYLGGKAGSPEKAAAMAEQMAPLAQIPAMPADNENYEAWAAVQQQYALFQAKGNLDFQTFCAKVTGDASLASQMAWLRAMMHSENAPALDILLDSLENLTGNVSGITSSANSALRDVSRPASIVTEDLAVLCEDMEFLPDMVDDVTALSGTLRASSETLRQTVDSLRGAVDTLRGASGTLRDTLDAVSDASASLRETLEDTAEILEGAAALSDTLEDAIETVKTTSAALRGTLSALTNTSGDLRTVLEKAVDASVALRKTMDTAKGILTKADDLRKVANDYEPTLRRTLDTLADLSASAASAVRDADRLTENTEALMKSTGEQLDEGAAQTLDGLTGSLREAADGLNTTSDVQSAKDAITDLIEDTWDEYTGDTNNLLLMDPGAETQSLTSPQNSPPQSVQVLVRTQEIKEDDGTGSSPSQTAAAGSGKTGGTGKKSTFLGRVGQMFKDLWDAVSGIFRR